MSGRVRGWIHSVTAKVLRGIDRLGVGDTVWERGDWDVLVVVDACRYDVLDDVDDDCLTDETVSSHTSVASYSREFMRQHFADEYAQDLEETMLVVANPYSGEAATDRFAHVDEVWRDRWDDQFGSVRPGPVIDRALSAWHRRERHDARRMIVWLMQPHRPFRSRPEWTRPASADQWGNPVGGEVLWDRLRAGKVDAEAVWDAYVDNFEYAFEEVKRFVRNADGSIVVTSDHGNAFGELGFWGHPGHIPIPALRRVPWIELDGEGRWEFEPDREAETRETVDDKPAELLRRLGYRE